MDCSRDERSVEKCQLCESEDRVQDNYCWDCRSCQVVINNYESCQNMAKFHKILFTTLFWLNLLAVLASVVEVNPVGIILLIPLYFLYRQMEDCESEEQKIRLKFKEIVDFSRSVRRNQRSS